jgi:CSLREA domain-containing protein
VKKQLLLFAGLLAAGLGAGLLMSDTSPGAKPPPTTTTTPTCTLAPQLRAVTVNQGLNSYLALARGKETLVRPYLSLPTCAWGFGAIQITGGSIMVKNGTTPLIPSPGLGPTPAVATPFPQLATFATAPMQDAPHDLKFVVPGSVLLAGPTTRWTATFEVTIRYQSKTSDTASYGSEQSISFTTTKAVEQRTRAVGILFVPFGEPLSPTAGSAFLSGLSAFSGGFPYPDGTVVPGAAPGVRLGDLAGVQGGIRYAVNAGSINVGTLPFCGTAANFEPLKAALAQYRQAWNTGNAAAITAGTMSAADRVIGLAGNSNGGASGCLEGYASVVSQEAWIRTPTDNAGSLLGMEFCHTFGCVPPARSDGAFHSIQSYADTISGDVDRGYAVIDRSLILRPRSAMRLVTDSADPWNNSTTLLERDDYAFMLCQMGGFAAKNTPCTTSGGTGTLAGVAAGPAFVMSGTTDDSAAGTEIVNAYFETGVAQTTPQAGSQYRLVQKNAACQGGICRNDGVPVTKDTSVHEDGGDEDTHVETRGLFSVAFPFDTRATTIEFWKGQPGEGSVLLFTFSKTDPPVVTSFEVTQGADEPVITFASLRPPRKIESDAAPSLSDGAFSSVSAPFAILATDFVVNTADDHDDGTCAIDCTLREAIDAANAAAGTDRIIFNIPPGGPQTINVTEVPLPQISDPVVIDGTTQPGFDGAPIIELNGEGAANPDLVDENGLLITGGGTTVRGLVINRFTGNGIAMHTNGGNLVEGNYVGTNVAGTGDLGNTRNGVVVIGIGDNTVQSNVVSGNGQSGIALAGAATGNIVRANFVGTTFNGTGMLGNSGDGIFLGGSLSGVSANTIGGPAGAGADRNIVSANGGYGIRLNDAGTTGNTVEGNYVGTDITGTLDFGNTLDGIVVSGGAASTIIKRNVVSGNGLRGIQLSTAGAGTQITGNAIGTDWQGTADLGNAADGVRIDSTDGVVVGGVGAGNLVSGNGGHGILLHGSIGSTVQGNFAGTNNAGNAAIPNGIDGIGVDGGANNIIGGTATGAGNLASGNSGQGIAVFGVDFPSTTGNVVQGNFVGSGVSRGAFVPNGGDGIRVHNGNGTTIGGTAEGAANLVVGNGAAGVAIFEDASLGRTARDNRVSRNSIHSNGGLGIDLARAPVPGVTPNDLVGFGGEGPHDSDEGANHLQNFPVLTAATSGLSSTTIEGTLGSTPGTTFTIEFFSNSACDGTNHGEGQTFLGSTTATTSDPPTSGNATFTFTATPAVPVGRWITATATDPAGNTSEFSQCRQAVAGGATEPGPVDIDVEGLDDNPGTLANPLVRGTLYWRCGGTSSPNYPLIVDATPSAITPIANAPDKVEFHLEVDTEPFCAGGDEKGTFTFRMTDLWQQSVENQQSHQTAPSGQESPNVSILSPADLEHIRENDGVTLVGNAYDGEDQAIPPGALQWTVECQSGCTGFTTVTGTGNQLDVKTEIPGTYKATLSVAGFGSPASTFVTYIVDPDGDNDGLTDAEEALCAPANSSPSDDDDGDGIWNGNDPALCTPHAGPLQAEGDFNPDPLPLQSRAMDPSVTFSVRLPYRDLRQVDVATVRITRVGGKPTGTLLPATAWTVAADGVATAKFDRGTLINFINLNGLQDKTIVIEVEGSAPSQGWSFFASDSTTAKS